MSIRYLDDVPIYNILVTKRHKKQHYNISREKKVYHRCYGRRKEEYYNIAHDMIHMYQTLILL